MKRAAIIIFALTLVGCVHYQPQPLNAVRRAEDFEARRLDDEQLRQFIEANRGQSLTNWPPQHWTLETLTLAAYYYQPRLDVARAQWRVAEAAAISAGARPNPTLSFSPGFTANPGNVTPWLMGAGFDWPIETAGKRHHRITQAQQLTSVARFNLITMAWQVRARVRDALAAYRFAEEHSGTVSEKVKLQQEIVARLEARWKAGDLSFAEVAPSRAILSRLEMESGVALENSSAAAAQLADAIGIPLQVLINAPKEMTLDTPELSVMQLADAKQRALLNRSDVLGVLAEYDASETALRLEIAKQYPDLHFNPNYEYDQGANKWKLGVSLELPVLNRNQGPIAEAMAKRDETAARFVALQAKVISEIDAATRNFLQVRQRYFEIIPAGKAELKQEQAVAAQVRAGAADALDLLNMKLERLTGVEGLAEAGHRSEVAFGQLEDALQQLLEQRPGVSAPAPPLRLEINPREGSAKP